ncbi:glycerophosphodiester phosphodiesterase family protein [Anaerofustis stercorihominis]|uniref:glycerophosphodiester phosphodiesterase family protein n=1 Tax=Anaerofustis stercorihominis TaxID=214853 RepID=UPI0026717B4B|nr:glycerophosphodiester phosphodiesterase family protein [Anaerofustis stercorihominis]
MKKFFKGFKDILKRCFKLIKYNIADLILFEIIYKSFILFAVLFCEDLFKYAVKISGITHLTPDNVILMIKNPLSAVICIILVFIFVYLTLLEIFGIIIYFESAKNRIKLSFIRIFTEAFKRSFMIFKPRNMFIAFMVLLFPLNNIYLTSGYLNSVRFPEFILDFIKENVILSIVYIIILILIYIVLFKYIFSIFEIVINKTDFKSACKKSSKILKGKFIKSVSYFIMFMIFQLLLTLFIVIIAYLFIILKIKLFYTGTDIENYYWLCVTSFNNFFSVLLSIFILIFNIAFLSVLYYGYDVMEDDNYILKNKRRFDCESTLKTVVKYIVIIMILLVYSDTFYLNGNINNVQIVAHRAGSSFGPENTVSALKEAIKAEADCAEIDVQQTKDKNLIVMHDTDFKRISGVDKKVWEVNLKEVKTYDAGSYFSSDLSNEKYPTLEEMLKAAKGKIDLMIELKSTGHEKDLEKKTIELIKKYKMENQCILSSMNYNILKKSKEIDKDIRTCYITTLFYGDVRELKYADELSVEATFINNIIVSDAHFNKKKIYAWTVNREENIRNLLKTGLDGIVTDNPHFTKYVIENRNKDMLAQDIYDNFYGDNNI